MQGAELSDRVRARLQRWNVVPVATLGPSLAFESRRRHSPESILTADELRDFESIRNESHAWQTTRGSHQRLIVILKLTRLCNLRCTYCHAWRDGPGQVMEFATVARAVATTLRKSDVREVDFVWHGGEVTTLRTDFARKVLWLQAQFAQPGQIIHNSIQTNAYSISDEWMELLVESGFSVGVSVDGSARIHDASRRTVGGRPTFERVMRNVARMRERGIDLGALVVVTSSVVELGAEALLRALVESDVGQVALLNEIPDINAVSPVAGDNFVPFGAFVEFLRELLPIWWSGYRDRLRIRELEAYIAVLDGKGARTCTLAGNCMGGYLTIDPDGTVAACDKYVGGRDYVFVKLGYSARNEIAESANLLRARQEADRDTESMPQCPFYSCCRGGCPHDNKLTRIMNGAPSACCGLRPLFEDLQSLTTGDRNG